MRAEVLERVVADGGADDLGADELRVVLFELGDRVAGEVLANEDGAPAGALVFVGDARRVELGVEPGALFRVQPEDVGDPRPGIGELVGVAKPIGVSRSRAPHDAARDDVEVVRGAARREHLALAIVDDAPGRRQWDAPDDVLVRDRGVRRPLEHLQLEQPAHDGAERDERHEGHPLEPTTELADVRARNEELAHSSHPACTELAVPPIVESREPVTVAEWSRSARRNTNGAISPVAITCGRTSL